MKSAINGLLASAILLSAITAQAEFDPRQDTIQRYRIAAEQGDAAAQYNLGVKYTNGEGVPQNYQEAVRWYRLAANQGYASAQNNLGMMYATGRGVTQDYKEAAHWYRLAANQGIASAQNNLAVMYENGQGVKSSRVVAFALYNVSAKHALASDNKAMENLARLSARMTAAEIAAGQALTLEISKPGMMLKILDGYGELPGLQQGL